MRILDVETIRRRLADRKVLRVAQATGLNPNTIYRLLNGTAYPSYHTLRKLSEYLTAESDENERSAQRKQGA